MGSTATDYAPDQAFATRSNSSFLREERIKRAPVFAKWRANDSPIPLEAPVIQTTLPRNTELAIKTFTTIYIRNRQILTDLVVLMDMEALCVRYSSLQ